MQRGCAGADSLGWRTSKCLAWCLGHRSRLGPPCWFPSATLVLSVRVRRRGATRRELSGLSCPRRAVPSPAPPNAEWRRRTPPSPQRPRPLALPSPVRSEGGAQQRDGKYSCGRL